MIIHTTSHFERQLRKLSRKNHLLPIILDQKIEILSRDEKYPSLKLHKLTGDQKEYWSISVLPNIRVVFRYTLDGIIFTNIGSHDEVY